MDQIGEYAVLRPIVVEVEQLLYEYPEGIAISQEVMNIHGDLVAFLCGYVTSFHAERYEREIQALEIAKSLLVSQLDHHAEDAIKIINTDGLRLCSAGNEDSALALCHLIQSENLEIIGGFARDIMKAEKLVDYPILKVVYEKNTDQKGETIFCLKLMNVDKISQKSLTHRQAWDFDSIQHTLERGGN